MTPEAENDSKKRQAIFLNPWIVGIGALIFYLLTLNHWVTLNSLPVMAQLTGWDWHLGPLPWRGAAAFPLLQILTAPLRLLPGSWQPVSLNIFSAICAAATLGLLAQSIRLFPQDRTKDQRQRALGLRGTLAVRLAFLAPLLAVIVLGLQISFWENAITATGEMLNVLIFAFLIFSLLQFRVTQNESWLIRFALVYGIGVTNSWSLIVYFPFFLVMVIALKGLGFFNLRFLSRIAAWGALGLLLYLLIPVISVVINGDSFFSALHAELAHQKNILTQVPRWIALVLGLPTWLALIFISIRWPSFEGDMSQAGDLLTSFMFRLFNIILFVASLWIFLDIKYSPREFELRITFLSFYYMAALNVGYFTGYILLVFGEAAVTGWRKASQKLNLFKPLAYAVVAIALVTWPAILIYRNFPQIKKNNSPALREFFTETVKSLPAKPSLILSDDKNWLFLIQAAGRTQSGAQQDILLDTTAFPHREYLRHLHNHYGEMSKILPDPLALPPVVDSQGDLLNFVELASRHYPLYYLHPSFGYYFEKFYAVPHGLVYELKPLQDMSRPPPRVSTADISANETFWQHLRENHVVATRKGANDWSDPVMVDADLSRALNNWAVELQKAGRRPEAGARFTEALRLNPSNTLARINQKYNIRLTAGNSEPMELDESILQEAGMYGGLVTLNQMDGPCEEPTFILEFASYLAGGGNLYQAATLFQRRLDFLPKDEPAKIGLARCYLDLNKPDESLKLVKELRAEHVKESFGLQQVEAIAYLRKNDYPKAAAIIEAAHRQNSNDVYQINALRAFYQAAASYAKQSGQTNEASIRYKKAVDTINRLITLLNSPAHATLNSSEIPDALLYRAQIEMENNQFSQAVTTLTDVLEREPTHRVGLINRASCYMALKKPDQAQLDFEKILKIQKEGNSDVYYGLAQVGEVTKNKKMAMRYFKLYMKDAPAYTQEYASVVNRMKELKEGR